MNQELKAYMDTRLRENQFIQFIGLKLTHIDKYVAEMELNLLEHHMQHTGSGAPCSGHRTVSPKHRPRTRE